MASFFSGLVGTSKDVDMDPNKLILGWTGLMHPPKWDDSEAFGECFHCAQPFASGHKHNCRLCGHIYCSCCSSKYYVPQEFKIKQKQGPDRVCYGCRDACLKRKADFYITKGLVEPPSKKFSIKDGVYHLFPCEWTDLNSAFSCNKCLSPLDSHRHNCRICGEVYCNDCTAKMNIPPQFEKKAKAGPARVCHDCRYKIFAKAVLEDKPMQDFPPPPTAPAVVPVTTSNTIKDLPPPAFPTNLDVTLKLCFQGENEPVVTLVLPPTATLESIHAKVVPKCPVAAFFYLCRGKPVWPEHYDLVTLKVASSELVLVRGTIDAYLNKPKAVPAQSSVIVDNTSTLKAMTEAKEAINNVAEQLIKKAEKEAQLNSNNPNSSAAIVKPLETVTEVKPTTPAQTQNQQSTAYPGKKVIDSDSDDEAPPAAPANKQPVAATPVAQTTARTLYEFIAMDHTHLSFSARTIIIVLKHDNNQWWFGELNGARGWFPASYVELIPK